MGNGQKTFLCVVSIIKIQNLTKKIARYYLIFKRLQPGINNTWDECFSQIKLTFFILGKSLSYKKSTLQSDKDSEMASSLAVDGG